MTDSYTQKKRSPRGLGISPGGGRNFHFITTGGLGTGFGNRRAIFEGWSSIDTADSLECRILELHQRVHAMALILELPDKKEAALKTKAESQGLSVEQYVENLLDRDLDEAPIPRQTQPDRHISDVIRDIWSDVPAEAWSEFPTDGASEHDHYIYGLPKRNL